MKVGNLHLIISFLYLCLSSAAFGQDTAAFKKDLRHLKNTDYADIDIFINEYTDILFPHDTTYDNDIPFVRNQLTFPLEGFAQEPLYQQAVRSLLADTAHKKQRLAGTLIYASRDVSHIQEIKKRMMRNDYRYFIFAYFHSVLAPHDVESIWAYVNHHRENEEFMFYAHYLIPSLGLTTEVFDKFSTENLYHTDSLRQLLAIEFLKYTPLTPKKEKLIRDAVDSFDLSKKEAAIKLLATFQIADVLELLEPYIANENLTSACYRALSASPTPRDGQFLLDVCLGQDSLQRDTYHYLIASPQPENVHHALDLLLEKPVASSFHLFANPKTLLYGDEFLDKIHQVVLSCNDQVKQWFIPFLAHRYDAASTQILLDCLAHENSGIRHEAALALKTNPSETLGRRLPDLIKSTDRPTPALTDIAIYQKNDTLHAFYEQMYESNPNNSWETKALEYLATFPQERHKAIFQSALVEEKFWDMKTETSALALGRLQDTASVDLIIKICREARKQSEHHCEAFVEALAKIKGDKALEELKTFEKSMDKKIRHAVREALDNW